MLQREGAVNAAPSVTLLNVSEATMGWIPKDATTAETQLSKHSVFSPLPAVSTPGVPVDNRILKPLMARLMTSPARGHIGEIQCGLIS